MHLSDNIYILIPYIILYSDTLHSIILILYAFFYIFNILGYSVQYSGSTHVEMVSDSIRVLVL